VIALDVPQVLATTRRAVADAGMTDRFEFVAGDMFTADLPPAGYDIVLLGNICHLFDGATNQRLLTRLRPALRPGGTLAIVDAVPSGDTDEHRRLSLYALGLRLRTRAGAVHPLTAYRTWTSGAGYGPLSAAQVAGRPPMTLLTARASTVVATPRNSA
jgi:SAM-dependent methyltransferase